MVVKNRVHITKSVGPVGTLQVKSTRGKPVTAVNPVDFSRYFNAKNGTRRKKRARVIRKGETWIAEVSVRFVKRLG